MKPMQITSWSFCTTYNNIDIARILRETPAECSAVEISFGECTVLAVRNVALDRANAIGTTITSGAADGWLSHIPAVDTPQGITGNANASWVRDWKLAWGAGVKSLDDIMREITAVNAVYSAKLRVRVRAA